MPVWRQCLQLDRDYTEPLRGRRGTPATPPLNPVVARQILDHAGQVGGQPAAAAELAQGAVVVLDQTEMDPGGEILGVLRAHADAPRNPGDDPVDLPFAGLEQSTQLLGASVRLRTGHPAGSLPCTA